MYQLAQTINHHFPDLFERLREIPDFREKPQYELATVLSGALAIFLFKSGSRNAFNNDRATENFEENFRLLFKMPLVHGDTIEHVLRVLEPAELEKLKHELIVALLQKKTIHKYRLMSKWFLVAIDGSGLQSCQEEPYPGCPFKEYKNKEGQITKRVYFPFVVEAKIVCSNGFSISIGSEWVKNENGKYDKQDCEGAACKRLVKRLRKEFPRLSICLCVDGLYPNEPFFELCKRLNFEFIVTFKDGNLPSVQKKVSMEIKRQEKKIYYQKGKKITQRYRWINNIDYRGFTLNWIECIETVFYTKTKKEEDSKFVHLTSITITDDYYDTLSQSGRLRWKIENEGFNTQKNGGYNLMHKYSRVSFNARKNYYQLLQIAHLINQLLEKSSHFKVLVKGKTTIKHLWKVLIAFLYFATIDPEVLEKIQNTRVQFRYD